MQPALALIWMILGTSLALGTVLMIAGLVRAPEGFEDADGFQYTNDGEADGENQASHPSHPELA